MTSRYSALRDPSRRKPPPEPVAVNLQRVIVTGMVVWLLVLAGSGVAALAGVEGAGAWAAVAGAGIALGLLGIMWTRRNPDRLRPGP